MVPILINKDVFKPSYNDVKSTVWNHNYVCTTLIVFFSIFQTLQRKMEDHTWDNFAGQYQKWYILILLTFHWPEFSYMTTSSFKGGLNVYPTLPRKNNRKRYCRARQPQSYQIIPSSEHTLTVFKSCWELKLIPSTCFHIFFSAYCERQNKAHVLIPETCDYDILHGERTLQLQLH